MDKNKKEDIGKLFNSYLETVEKSPNPKVWEDIHKTLKRKARLRLIYWGTSSLCLLAIIVFAVFRSNGPKLGSDKETEINILEHTADTLPQTKKHLPLEENKNNTKKASLMDSVGLKSTTTENDTGNSENAVSPHTNATIAPENHKARSVTQGQKTVHTTGRTVLEKESKTIQNQASQKENKNHIINRDKEAPSINHNKSTDKATRTAKVPKEFSTTQNAEKNTSVTTDTARALNLSKKRLSTTSYPIMVFKDSIPKIKINLLLQKSENTDSLSEKNKENFKRTYHLFPFLGGSRYGRFNNRSTIDLALDSNEKSANLQTSFGAYLVLRTTSKLDIRFGLSQITLNKETLGIAIAPNDNTTNFYRNVNFRDGLSFESFSTSFSEASVIDLEERLVYYELPLELAYLFWSNKNWSLRGISGFSVSFLAKNELVATRDDGTTEILGANNNYTNTPLGLHLGFGAYYNINNSIELGLEPFLKPRFGAFNTSLSDGPVLFNVNFGVYFKL